MHQERIYKTKHINSISLLAQRVCPNYCNAVHLQELPIFTIRCHSQKQRWFIGSTIHEKQLTTSLANKNWSQW